MNATNGNTLSWRRFVTLQVLLGFTLLTATGLVMFFWPPREVAMATHYTLLGAGKHTWENVHLTFSFLFIGAAGIHLDFSVWLYRTHASIYGSTAAPCSATWANGQVHFASIWKRPWRYCSA